MGELTVLDGERVWGLWVSGPVPDENICAYMTAEGVTIADLGMFGEWLIEEAAKNGLILSPEDIVKVATALIPVK